MLRDVYARQALLQVSRLLTLQDRNPLSRTYGCLHRDYWLYKTSDFSDAVRQFGVHALALAYSKELPGSPFFHQPKMCEWAIAGLEFWASIQHGDGSFDEFYPYERGWVGPTAFTTYTSCESYALLREHMDEESRRRVENAIAKAASFIAKGESESDHLANHHAMAALAVWKAYKLLGDSRLRSGFDRLIEGFRRLHVPSEGWSVEYDGPDPGYQSATVSFLAKIWADGGPDDLLDILDCSVEFCSYFAFPDGHYAGMIGSRNTVHFYPHGFELLASRFPLAGTVADRMLEGLNADKLVPPHIMSDRYVCYRVPELLLSYLDYGERARTAILPDQREDFDVWLPKARLSISSRGPFYAVANLSKGGVVKVFDRRSGRLLLGDGGVLGQLDDGRLVTSQWVDAKRECKVEKGDWSASGNLQVVPSDKTFTPVKGLIFRLALVCVGWIPWAAHRLKGLIRKSLMLGSRPVGIRMERSFAFDDGSVRIVDEIERNEDVVIRAIHMGDDFNVRYVPQSRFFQTYELLNSEFEVTLDKVAGARRIRVTRQIAPDESGKPLIDTHVEAL